MVRHLLWWRRCGSVDSSKFMGTMWSSAFWRLSLAILLEVLSWNECLLLRYTTVCSSVTRAIGFSFVGYEGGGVGDPLFPEFVLFLLWRWFSCDKWLSVHVKSLICSCKGSVTPMTLDLRAFSEAPFISLFKRSRGILDADQIPSKRTKRDGL